MLKQVRKKYQDYSASYCSYAEVQTAIEEQKMLFETIYEIG